MIGLVCQSSMSWVSADALFGMDRTLTDEKTITLSTIHQVGLCFPCSTD